MIARIDTDPETLKRIIIDLARTYVRQVHRRKPFEPGDRITYSTHVFDDNETANLIEVALSQWLPAGKWAEEFEARLGKFFGARDALLVNSGSSANLLMVATLCAPSVADHLKPGDEVITVAAGFPTTLAPIVQYGLVPVFVDVDLRTYNPDPNAIEDAIGPRTRAVFLPHPMGLPFDADAVADICARHGLWLLEDGCDILAGEFNGRMTGTFGAMSSLSFFPAHFLTCGEAGAVIVNSAKVARAARSIAAWGKDCYCLPGKNNTCGKRFEWDWELLPRGYDHKYVWSHIGYNLKATDMQAAVLCAQLDKIPFIVSRRRQNFEKLFDSLCRTEVVGKFYLPKIHRLAKISPYSFPLVNASGIPTREVIAAVEAAGVETRPIFAGNLLRQPAFSGIECRVHGSLQNTDRILHDGFFVGVHPLLGDAEMEYIARVLAGAVANR